jgi:hypothetical protein
MESKEKILADNHVLLESAALMEERLGVDAAIHLAHNPQVFVID